MRDVPDRDRYELTVDGELAGLVGYRRVGRRLVLLHAEVDRRFEGRGLGGLLVGAVLDQARASGRTVTPRCPFVVEYLRRHPEERDVVDPDHPGGLEA